MLEGSVTTSVWCWMPSKTLRAKMEWKVRDAAALQGVVFISRCFATVLYLTMKRGEQEKK